MFGLGMGELVVIMLIVILLFGSKKLPELGKGVGEALREFKRAGRELDTPPESKVQPKSTTKIPDKDFV